MQLLHKQRQKHTQFILILSVFALGSRAFAFAFASASASGRVSVRAEREGSLRAAACCLCRRQRQRRRRRRKQPATASATNAIALSAVPYDEQQQRRRQCELSNLDSRRRQLCCRRERQIGRAKLAASPQIGELARLATREVSRARRAADERPAPGSPTTHAKRRAGERASERHSLSRSIGGMARKMSE